MKTEVQPRRRMSADERREEILAVAIVEFALKGLHGTSTETIAERAGVSQPYLFRLFGTKKDLFLAAGMRVMDRVRDLFVQVAETHPENQLEAMGNAYVDLLEHREDLLMQMQLYAACSDPEIAEQVRQRYLGLWDTVGRHSGAEDDDLREFFAAGMLLNVAVALKLPEVLTPEEWSRYCLPAPS
jgi:AcrR family transcriptional regulator